MKKNKYITQAKPERHEAKRDGQISVILLAENYGYRMKSYGPISLVEVGGKTLLQHQIAAIQSAFTDFEIILCSGFETQKVYHYIQSTFPQSLPIRIVENQVFYHSNCCEGLRLCLHNTMNERVLICGGGVVLTADYLKSLNMRKSSILCQEPSKELNFDVGIIDNADHRLEHFSLAVKQKVWTELLYLTGSIAVKSFYNTVSKPELKNKFLFEAVNQWRGRKQLLVCENDSDTIIKIDNIKTLKRMNPE
jgi:choline kinase